MTLIRTILFNILFFIWMPIILVVFHIFFFSIPILIVVSKVMATVNAFLLRYVAGIKLEIWGHENLPSEGCVIASKHQSALETLALFHKVHKLAYVFKKELGYIPLFGTSNYLVGNVAVDRGGAGTALKSLIRNVKKAIDCGRKVMIFPEGTRTSVGKSAPLKPSVYALYKQGFPIIPCALNTGCFWPKKSIMKYSGTAKIRFLPQIEEGLSKQEFNKKLQESIELESIKLIPEGYKV